ncbi:unnamed protein product [Fraxinus pennsylvanica]|uniref:Uncharacterized protein n=1 Tax=Fraxinus pennsylvanica TaxID=56036 RepID=A0AAD2E9J7_9LAMI|nr:unnamed protein product [Fraxinus pennsylvanica]
MANLNGKAPPPNPPPAPPPSPPPSPPTPPAPPWLGQMISGWRISQFSWEITEFAILMVPNSNPSLPSFFQKTNNDQVGDECPDLDDVSNLKLVFNGVQNLNEEELISAGHDISDGGLIVSARDKIINNLHRFHRELGRR